MKRFLSFFHIILLFIFLFVYHNINLQAAETPSDLYAKAAILMDGKNQRVLFGKEEQTELPMASTTKIMTCLFALEHGKLTDTVTFSQNAASAPKVHLGAQEGDQFLLSDLLYALMLESYNDVAIAIAEHISGSVEGFCQAMTDEARAYGCYHTSFETPNGLDSENHYTTCYDLAILTCRALQNKEFRTIIHQTSCSIKELKTGKSYSLNNKNAFLASYPGAIGVKTGYTSGAGYCFVGAVETEDRLLISAVLGSGWYPNRTYKWKDTKKLMDYGMENFENQTIEPGENIPDHLAVHRGQSKLCPITRPESVTLLLGKEETASCKTDLPSSLSAPIKKGDSVGKVSLFINETLYREYPIRAKDDVRAISFTWCYMKLLHKLLC